MPFPESFLQELKLRSDITEIPLQVKSEYGRRKEMRNSNSPKTIVRKHIRCEEA